MLFSPRSTFSCSLVAVALRCLHPVGRRIIQWNGSEANKYEKFKGLEMVTKLKDEERGGKAEIIVADEGKPFDEEKTFWEALGEEGPTKVRKGEGRRTMKMRWVDG